MGLDAVVLAGAKNNGQLSKISKEEYEALIKINNKSMIEHVIDTLKEVELIDNIIVVGPDSIDQSTVDKFVHSQDSLVENINLGLQMSQSPYTLILTSDIPLVTADAILDFLAKCEDDRAAFYYPIIPKQFVEISFPNSNKTYFTLDEGSFTGGNIFLVNGDVLLQLKPILDNVIKWRKSPWKLAYLLGFKFIIKLLSGSLSIELIEAEIIKLTNYKGRAIISDYPELGFDIDKIEQFKFLNKLYQGSEIKSN